MRKWPFFWIVFVILAFQFGTLGSAQADAVGRLTQVEGRVDILRAGKLPAIPVKMNDEVQTGDILRTKSKSKAQVTFIDSSTLTIAPESRVGIESYMFNASQNKRNAVVELFQGLAQVAVSKIFKATEPDFVVKTKTAIMGVRGTDFGIRIHPSSSDILNFEGLLQVGNILPEVSQLFRRAFAVAYSFGPPGAGGKRWVFLKTMQGTSVGFRKLPSPVFTVTPAMKSSFMEMFSTLGSKDSAGGGPTGPTGATGGGFTAGVGVLSSGTSVSSGAGLPGLPVVGETVPSSGFLGLYQPGTGGIIPLDPTTSVNPLTVVTPPVVPPVTTTVAPVQPTTPTTPVLPPHPPR
jgi:hypothetical protein